MCVGLDTARVLFCNLVDANTQGMDRWGDGCTWGVPGILKYVQEIEVGRVAQTVVVTRGNVLALTL